MLVVIVAVVAAGADLGRRWWFLGQRRIRGKKFKLRFPHLPQERTPSLMGGPEGRAGSTRGGLRDGGAVTDRSRAHNSRITDMRPRCTRPSKITASQAGTALARKTTRRS